MNPLAYQVVEGGYAVFASKGGADTNPDWLHNVRAHPGTKVEVGTEIVAVTAREAEGEERERIWNLQVRDWPGFGEYEEKTARDFHPSGSPGDGLSPVPSQAMEVPQGPRCRLGGSLARPPATPSVTSQDDL